MEGEKRTLVILACSLAREAGHLEVGLTGVLVLMGSGALLGNLGVVVATAVNGGLGIPPKR